MANCTKCGRELREDAHYCTACGTTVTTRQTTDSRPISKERVIPWWLGVAVGVLVVAVIGLLAWNGGEPPDSSVPGPPASFEPMDPPETQRPVVSLFPTDPQQELSIGGVSSPGLLPTSPFYFMKGIARDVRYAFTFDPVDKANLKLRYANQDALAIRALCLDEEYLAAAQQCFSYQDNFFNSLAWTIKARKQGDDVEALMLSLIYAHHGHRLVLANALAVVDEPQIEAVVGAITYTSAPLEQVIQWIHGVDEAAEFHSQLADDFAPLGGDVWEEIENRLGLEVEQSIALSEAMGDSAAIGPTPVVTSVRAEKATGVAPGSQVAITCHATDLSGGALTYQWLAAYGRIDGDGESVRWTAPAYTGTYQVTVVVSDDSGNQSSKTISIAVEAQKTPYPGYLGNELLAAAAGGDGEEVRMLLHMGADVNARGSTAHTPLHVAAFRDHSEVVNILLDHGADVDAVEENGNTPLFLAAWLGHTDVIRVLLDRGADVHIQGHDGLTALHAAAMQGQTGAAELLLEGGASVNQTADRDDTPLHYAATQGHTEVARLLLERGANVNARMLGGTTSLFIAKESGHGEMVKLLEEHGGIV